MAENEFDMYENGVASEKEGTKKARAKKTNAFTQILNGEFLTKEFVLNNLNYIFFIFFLLLVITTKVYYGKQLATKINDTQRDLDQQSAEYIEAKSKLEFETRRYKLVKRLEKRELKETQNATKVIRIKKETNE